MNIRGMNAWNTTRIAGSAAAESAGGANRRAPADAVGHGAGQRRRLVDLRSSLSFYAAPERCQKSLPQFLRWLLL
jgi:hypothetical protein